MLRHPAAALLVFIAVVAGGALTYTLAEGRIAGALGFPLDDAWIHLQFARHVAVDGQLAFNDGVPSAGSTAPLWSLTIAVPMILGFDPVISTKVIGTILMAIVAWLGWMLARELTGSTAVAWPAGLAIALSPRMTWAAVSGMEVPLYVGLVLAALVLYVRAPERLAPGWGLCAGLAGTARPETFLLFVLCAGHLVLAARREPAGLSRAGRPLIRAAVPFGLVFGIYAAVNFYADGQIWPTTLAAKSDGRGLWSAITAGDLGAVVHAATIAPLAALNTFVRFFFDQSALWALFVLPGVLYLCGWMGPAHPRAGLVAITLVAGPLTLGAMAPSLAVSLQEGRYVAHSIALAFVAGAAGAFSLARAGARIWAIRLLVLLALARLASQDVSFAARHAHMVANITSMHLTLGVWLREHTPQDALLAVNDIGAIAWVSGRTILDLEGIVTPAIVPYKRPRDPLAFLEVARPDYLVVFPEWYPDLVARTDLFTAIHSVTVPRVSAAHETMIVYATPWTRAR